MNFFGILIFFTLIIKIILLIFILIHAYYKYNFKRKPGDYNLIIKEKNTFKIKQNLDLLFSSLVALILIILFFPNNKNDLVIDKETKRILFLFGTVLFIKDIGIEV